MTTETEINRLDLRGLTYKELVLQVRSWGLPDYRARQLFPWLFRPGIESFAQMTDLSKDLRARLEDVAMLSRLEIARREVSQDGTVKYGFRLADGEMIESVLIPEEDRTTLCVSSQVGCAMGCRFCMTATMGFRRNLTPSEIVNQILMVRDDLERQGKPPVVSNLVFMGMGEPLANFDHLITALDILLDQRGLDFTDRRVTVSTCGLVPRMAALGRQVKVNLAVSLHAATDDLRDQLMPVNRTYPIATLLSACREFPMPRRKRIMFEYILFAGVNDSENDAKALAKILRGIPCKINLLPYNECPDLPFRRPPPETVAAFQEILRQANYTVFVRDSRGADIAAACGQLASGTEPPSPPGG